jgi:hypothetical protein
MRRETNEHLNEPANQHDYGEHAVWDEPFGIMLKLVRCGRRLEDSNFVLSKIFFSWRQCHLFGDVVKICRACSRFRQLPVLSALLKTAALAAVVRAPRAFIDGTLGAALAAIGIGVRRTVTHDEGRGEGRGDKV